jgi:hypothetical protein
MDVDQFVRKYSGTHTELQGQSLLRENMSRKDLRKFELEKREIEINAGEKRMEKLSEFLTDAVDVRKVEVLSKDDLPMKDLLAMTIRSHPQRARIENTGNVNFTFADMVARSSITLNKVEEIDAEISDD